MGSELLTNGVAANGLYETTPVSDELIHNDSPKTWVVQKFGGTSVGKVPTEIAQNIVKQHLKEHRVAVVCSARSSDTKLAGTTNRLLRAAKAAEANQTEQYRQIVATIQEDHVDAVKRNIKNPTIVEKLCEDIDRECQDLVLFLAAAQRVEEVSAKTLDTVISKGENLSCRLMVGLLQDLGVDAKFVDLSHASSFSYGQGLDQTFYNHLSQVFSEAVAVCGQSIPVVTGYFGVIQGGLLNQIGRGYTDLCAALLAVGLHAEELQVWKEVDGIFTANPHKVPTARLLPTISPAEAAELTYYGSEVIHPFTMEQVIRARIPIRIRNVMNLRNQGTIILPDLIASPPSTPTINGRGTPNIFRTRSSSVLCAAQRPKRPTAITIKHKILVLNVHSNKRSLSHGFFANIFTVLDKWRLSVDLISTSEVHVSMALHSESALVSGDDNDKEIIDNDLKGAVEELARFGTVDISDGLAILSLVGKQMKNMMGIAGKMFSVLGENNVNIEMISQGASEINISCVIEERDADRAINILHTNLFTFLD